jgi:hypothetical protein
MTNLKSFLEQTSKEYGLNSGEYLKLKEGDNKIRLVSSPVPHQSVYKGNITFKYLIFVLDRVDGKIKPFFCPVTVMRTISELQQDADWSFEGFPMPYDINIKANGAGTKEVKYSVIASPVRTELTIEQVAEIAQKDIKAFQQKLKDADLKKLRDERGNEPTYEQVNTQPDPNDLKISSIPF